jgi:hypothetical protein
MQTARSAAHSGLTHPASGPAVPARNSASATAAAVSLFWMM